MPDTSASTGQLSHDSVHLRPRRSRRFASDPLRNDSVQNKTVRFGSLEPAHVALAKKIILPLVVVLMLTICVLGFAFDRLFRIAVDRMLSRYMSYIALT